MKNGRTCFWRRRRCLQRGGASRLCMTFPTAFFGFCATVWFSLPAAPEMMKVPASMETDVLGFFFFEGMKANGRANTRFVVLFLLCVYFFLYFSPSMCNPCFVPPPPLIGTFLAPYLPLIRMKFSGVCVLSKWGHQQSYHSWTVGDGFLDIVGMSWRRRTRKLTEKLVMEVAGTSKCRVVWSALFSSLQVASSVFRGRRQSTMVTKRRRIHGCPVSQIRSLKFWTFAFKLLIF